MSKIQIDMFEVQLGASLLLQFETDDGPVRVLADAGVKAKGYDPDHVHKKLLPLLGDRKRIDLVIGTHYDEDHLNGLVSIFEDKTIEIGEAWMPPIANETQPVAIDQRVSRADLLTHQLYGEGGKAVLKEYLSSKASDIQQIAAIEAALDPEAIVSKRLAGEYGEFYVRDGEIDLGYFRVQLGDGADNCEDIDHGCDQELEFNPSVLKMVETSRKGPFPHWHVYGETAESLSRFAEEGFAQNPAVAKLQSRSLTHLRRSAAKDAINAKALHDVLQELSKRDIPVRSEIIDDGTPRRYRWDTTRRRFLPSAASSSGLVFDLLGPSASLVKKHRDRLPVLDASKIALAFRGELKSITPSNQLSYVACYRHLGQNILVTGDAGFVDFSQKQGTYFPKLLAALQPLHVIQVAHHGGNNGHFYRVLAEANYAVQTEQSFLLLSHAYQDKFRPSAVFREFLLTMLSEGKDISLLFTSQPQRQWVEDYIDSVHPVVGSAGKVGDVRLGFDDGWEVIAHAVRPGERAG